MDLRDLENLYSKPSSGSSAATDIPKACSQMSKRQQVRSLSRFSIVFLIVVLAMRTSDQSLVNLSYFVLALFALAGDPEVILALAMSWLLTMLSPGIAPIAEGAAIGRYAVIMSAALSVIIRNPRNNKFFKTNRWILSATVSLGSLIIIHSAFISPYPEVSILKAILWTVTLSTLLVAWGRLSLIDRINVENLLFNAMLVILIVSLPLAMTSLGRLRNNTGLQGILNHPQAFGPFAALLGAWIAGKLLFSPHPPFRLLVLMMSSLFAIFLSEARTAGGAFLLSVAITMSIGPMLTGVTRLTYMPALASLRFHGLVMGGLLAAIFFGGTLLTLLGDYVSKRTDASDVSEAAYLSRGHLLTTMIANIERDPWGGIGFGIASEPSEMIVEYDSVLGLPTSATIEKGILPIAIVEELGLFIAMFVALWMGMILRCCAASGPEHLAVGLSAFLCNLGESTLFSPSGYGLLPLLVIAWAVTGKPIFPRQPKSFIDTNNP